MSSSGKLVVFEGADKTGKSSLTRAATEWLAGHGVETALLGFPGNELGTLGNLVHKVHHHPEDYNIGAMNPLSLQTLHIAAHIEAIEHTILPAIRSGAWVVLDRFWWSTLVYGLANNVDRRSLELLIEVERIHWAGVSPAIAFLIVRDSAIREEHPHESFGRLSSLYRELAKGEAHRHPVRVIENQCMAEALQTILRELEALPTDRP
jgi:thymidylate kinase